MIEYLLSLTIFIPLIAVAGVLFVPKAQHVLIKWVALAATFLQLVLALILIVLFDGSLVPTDWAGAFQFVEQTDWIWLYLGDYGWLVIDYYVGVDGISILLVVLSALLLVIGVLSSWNLTVKVKEYFILYLILSTSIIGCFVALDLFLFYVFFEFMLLPMFFLIGIWGGARRAYASIKFFIYTLFGSLLILIVVIGLYMSVEDPSQAVEVTAEGTVHTFSLVHMMEGSYIDGSVLAPGSELTIWGIPVRFLAFILLLVGFAIKLPAVPVHTWLPDAHVEAPTAISVLLAGILLKVGGYGLFRITYGIFPDAAIAYAYPIGSFGVISIIYGGLSAMAQGDLKRLIAYSSVSHMGFVMLGLAALTTEGVSGSLFQMISHGLISGALFLLVGVIYDRTHDRRIENFSGLASRLPVYTFFTVLFFFASLGLPGLSGFVGEFLVLMGSITSDELPRWVGILAVSGIIISAAYYLWALQRMFFGDFWAREQSWETALTDLTAREWLMLLPLAVLVVLFGVFPGLILDPVNNSIQFFVETSLAKGQLYLSK